MSNAKETQEMITIKPGRDIVSSMVLEFREELREVVDRKDLLLTLDLDGVQMIDSMGLGVLIGAHNSLAKRNARLELTNICDDIFNLMKNMRLDKHFSIRQSAK
ncbi:MAG: STAS domain-containing protein [Desulfobulbaceae bacterium]|nr:STAS domain-containing protein [Desulfobulbaceae bacterium]